jgi:hypothetical protein
MKHDTHGPQPYREKIPTKVFADRDITPEQAAYATLTEARRKMAHKPSYPICKCCGEPTRWVLIPRGEGLSGYLGTHHKVAAYLFCPTTPAMECK